MSHTNQCHSCGVELPEDSTRIRCERCEFLGALLLPKVAAPTITPAVKNPATSSSETETEFGDYVLLSEIARGGMGTVHRARQKSLSRIVALKRPLPGVAADPERVRRFRTEAESVATLSHPNIIPVFESGEYEGEQFFSMAYVEGQTLSEHLRGPVVSTMKAARYIRTIAGAIHHAHQRGVLHRDLKPANIIIDLADEPRVADFGIACLLQGDTNDAYGTTAGTPNYMAPEQVRPEGGILSVATDVYALGGILYHLITGRPPFMGERKEDILWSAYYEDPVPPSALNSSISSDLEAICLKALQKLPENRYGSAQDMADDLLRFEQGRPVTARPVSAPLRCWMWIRRNTLVFLLLVSLGVTLVSVIVVQMNSIEKVRSARADSEGFIGFMNQDLARDLREVGRLDLMEKINSRAEDYYTNHSALGDASYLERKAAFFENSAVVKKDLGNLSQAEQTAVEAEKLYESQHLMAPTEGRWKRHQSHVRLLRHEIARKAGLRPLAAEHLDLAVSFATLAAEIDGLDPTNRANLASVLMERAAFQIGLGLTEAPATNVARAEELLREVVKIRNADPEWSLWLANGLYYHGRIAELRRDRQGALDQFSSYLQAMRALVARYPRNNRWQYELAIANSLVAVTLKGLKEFAEAQRYFDALHETSKNLVQLDPRNKRWLSLYAKSLAWQGLSASSSGNSQADAFELLNSALQIQNNLVQQSPESEQWIENAFETTIALMQLHSKTGRLVEAQDLAADWLRQCEARVVANPGHVGHQLRWSEAVLSGARETRKQNGLAGQIDYVRAEIEKLASFSSGESAVVAKAQLLSALAGSLGEIGDMKNAIISMEQALEMRLGFFRSAPMIRKVRDSIPNNFRFVAGLHLKSGDLERAISVAERGVDWAVRNLFAEENRSDAAQLCSLFTEIDLENQVLLARVRQLVQRCVTERLAEPPPLTDKERELKDKLQWWLDQTP